MREGAYGWYMFIAFLSRSSNITEQKARRCDYLMLMYKGICLSHVDRSSNVTKQKARRYYCITKANPKNVDLSSVVLSGVSRL